MNLLTFVARKFNVPLEHAVHRQNSDQVYQLTAVTFTNRQLVGTYGEDDHQFDVIIRGEA